MASSFGWVGCVRCVLSGWGEGWGEQRTQNLINLLATVTWGQTSTHTHAATRERQRSVWAAMPHYTPWGGVEAAIMSIKKTQQVYPTHASPTETKQTPYGTYAS